MVEIKECTMEHIDHVKDNLRRSDREELYATSGKEPEKAVIESFFMSRKTWSMLLNGVPAVVLGVADFPEVSGVGVPWMVATDDIQKSAVKMAVLRCSKKFVEDLLSMYPHLINFVDSRNKVSIQWLKWCGFTVHKAQPYGAFNLPFHRFDMGA